MTVNQTRREFLLCTALTNFASSREERRPPLLRVKCKTGYAAARSRMVVHAVLEMSAVSYRGRLRFATRWLCGGGSANAVPVADFEAHGGICSRCADMLVRGVRPGGVGYVYRCVDDAGQLLYVGSTVNEVSGRLAVHEKTASWWQEVASVRVEQFGHEIAARGAEFRAIRTEGPRYNVVGRRTRGAA